MVHDGGCFMEKNQFLVINDLIYEMYNWRSLEDIKENFFQRLKLIVPFSYASKMKIPRMWPCAIQFAIRTHF